jgi:hypothetical protein
MDLPKRFARSGIVLYFQIAAAVVSILLGLAQITKETSPMVHQAIEQRKLSEAQKAEEMRQAEVVRLATEQSQMRLDYQYRGNDGVWRYYSDPTNNYWVRVNIDGVQEYSRNPRLMIAQNPTSRF